MFMAALVLCAGAPAAAQALWSPEIGVQGGFARVKPAGTNFADQADLFDLPGFFSGYGSAFAIIPASGRLAIEASLGFAQASVGEPTLFFQSVTTANLGLRGDVAVGPHVYGAAGFALNYQESGGLHDHHLGIQAAVGYRTRLTGALRVRAEATWITLPHGARGQFVPLNVYGLLLGISGTGRAGAAPARSTAGWRPALGIAGGYVRSHLSGLGLAVDATTFALPGEGSDQGVATPATLFAIVPLTSRIAIEPGFDFHRARSFDNTVAAWQTTVRADVRLTGGWYAAGGGGLLFLGATGMATIAQAGALVAVGYEVPRAGPLGLRAELDYSSYQKRQDFPFSVTTFGAMVGVIVPLK